MTCVAQQKTEVIDSTIKATYNSNPDVKISIELVHGSTQYFFIYGTVISTESQRVDSITTFEIGSITKLFTSYLIAQQAQAGRISLDSFVDEYLPPQVKLNPKIQSKIKVSDLASHQSGLPDFDMLRLLQLNPVQPLDEVTTEMVDSILVHTSDLESLGAYQYSNISYVLLGYILENVVGSNYEKIVNNNLLKPLKMKNTFTSDFSSGISTMGYDFQNNKRGFLNWNCVIAPAGLLKSNTSDMLKFIQFLLATDD
ncbi:MAG: serine hydrolase domain-containing protein [Pleurocapsa sp.]